MLALRMLRECMLSELAARLCGCRRSRMARVACGLRAAYSARALTTPMMLLALQHKRRVKV